MPDLWERYYITNEEVLSVKCEKVPSYAYGGDTFVVTKHDSHHQKKDRVVVRVREELLHCNLNNLGGSEQMNARLPARPITESEEVLYVMRAVNALTRVNEEGTETIYINDLSFKHLLSPETDVDVLDEVLKGLVHRFFKNLPQASLSSNDIFVSTKFFLGDIQLRLLALSDDGYMRKERGEQFVKDREGFKGLQQERQAKSVVTGDGVRMEKEDFAFVADKDLRAIIERDFEEVQKVRYAKAAKATIVMAGSVIEALLLQALLKDSSRAKRSQKAPSENDLRKWGLHHLIEVAEDLGIIREDTTKFADTVKDYRNLIHPGREVRIKLQPKPEEAEIAFQVLKKTIKDLKAGT